MIDNALNVQQRLMRHTEYNESSGCWEWFGSKRNGYGRMIIGSRTDGPETCTAYVSVITNADRIRAMSDEELSEFLTNINPTNCQDCAFSHGWRCQPDRDDYSDFEKCKEGRKRWLKQPAEGE